MTGSRMLRFGDAMSILARSTRVAVWEFSFAHALEEVEILFCRAIAIRAFFAGLGERAAMPADFLGGQIVNVGFAVFDQLDCPLVKLVEVIGRIAEAVPLETQPADVFHDGVDVLLLFLFGIGVVKAQVGLAAEFVGQSEIKADGLRVANVEVAVWLGREAGLDDGVAELFSLEVVDHRVADEVRRTGLCGRGWGSFHRR